MSNKIMTVKSIRIPLVFYTEIVECLQQEKKIYAIKALRKCDANIEDEFVGGHMSSQVLGLKECKHIVDWIQANSQSVFTNDRWALVPASILE